MNLQFSPIFAALITASVMTVSAYIAYRNHHSEWVKLTRDLYNQFFSMLKERYIAWFWLEKLNSEKHTRGFESLWEPEEEADKILPLYKVLAFWQLFYRLHQTGQLDETLAQSLFGYEFFYWQRRVFPLVERTREFDRVFPDVFEPFEKVDWLLSSDCLPKAARLNGKLKSK